MSILNKGKYNKQFASERWGVSNAPHFICENFQCSNNWDIYEIKWNKRISYCVLCNDCFDHYNTIYEKVWPSNTYSKLLEYISDTIVARYWDIKFRTIIDSLNSLVWWDDTIARWIPVPAHTELHEMPVRWLRDLVNESESTRVQPLTSEMLTSWQDAITWSRVIIWSWRSWWQSNMREQYMRSIWIEEVSYETATRG